MKHPPQSHTVVTIWSCSAQADEALRDQLAKQLSHLTEEGLIAWWQDRQLPASTHGTQERDEALETASIILLLMSADFLASRFCNESEMQRALTRHRQGEARVIPLLLRPCDWQRTPFGQLPCLPRDGRAVTSWLNPDEAFQHIARELRQIIEQVRRPQLTPLDQRNRRVLLKRVRTMWIEGVLEHSLHPAAFIPLDLHEQPDALVQPRSVSVPASQPTPRGWPSGTALVQVYDEAQSLLILGEPGAGKTTLLLDLARTLLQRAEDDPHQRLPVVFPLSSWAQKRLPLADWLVEELHTTYQVSREIATTWLATEHLLPLLDGLDEVAPHARDSCAEAINTYCQTLLEKGTSLALVVCCRSPGDDPIPPRLRLARAVSLQPLTDEQITRALESTHEQLSALREACHTNADLQDLLRRPLLLHLFTLASRGVHHVELPMASSPHAKQQHLVATYVEQRLPSRSQGRELFAHWLTVLAKQMQQHHQTVFAVESLQPDWLPNTPRHLCRWSVILACGLVSGLLVGMVSGLLAGLLVGLASGVLVGLEPTIEPEEERTWSWQEARSGLVFGLFFGLLVGVLVALVFGLFFGLLVGLSFGLFFGLLVVLFFGLLGGRSRKHLSTRPHPSANEGIRRSATSGLVIGLGMGVVIGLLSTLVGGVSFGLVSGLVGGLLLGLSFGLAAWVKHLTVRLWLWRTGALPWDVGAFLEEAAERRLLSKAGGNYLFVHRLLLDFFASREQPESSESLSAAETTEGA